MSWKNIKTFMIILLLIACVVIGTMLLLGGKKELYTKDSLEKSVSLMEKSGILITSAQLKGTFDDMNIYRFTLPQDYPERVAEGITVGNITDIYAVPGGVEMHTDSAERVFIGTDLSISYYCQGAPRDISEEEIGELLAPDCTSPSFGVRREGSEINGASEFVTFVQTVEGLPITENQIKCRFTDGKLASFEGKWCFPDKCGTFSAQLRDYLNIMFTERERVNSEAGGKRTLTVKELEKCYGVENSDGKSVFILVPSLHIIYKEGESAIHSAVVD